MNTLKSIIANNIASLRIANNMTQLALAEKLCYSDKAISKWERGESVPDISVLKQIADLFGVTVDYIITDHSQEGAPAPAADLIAKRSRGIDHLLITLISVIGVWSIGLLCFIIVWVESSSPMSIIFICCIPVSALVLLVLNSVWGLFGKRRLINVISISLLIWGFLLTLFCLTSVWQLFLLGIPAQILTVLSTLIRFGKRMVSRSERADKSES